MSQAATTDTAPSADLAALARGGRINFFGFVLRLMARLPFLFIAGRMYGPSELGRFAYAVLILEFASQLATLGLKRGLAQQLAKTDKPHVCVVADALLVAAVGSAIAMTALALPPGDVSQFRNPRDGVALPITVPAGLNRHMLRWLSPASPDRRARAIIEPPTISIAAFRMVLHRPATVITLRAIDYQRWSRR